MYPQTTSEFFAFIVLGAFNAVIYSESNRNGFLQFFGCVWGGGGEVIGTILSSDAVIQGSVLRVAPVCVRGGKTGMGCH